MSRLQAIENVLVNINETVFQELCDCFLALRNSNYRAFSRTGSQSGKQKTIKGTPDTFLLLSNGEYIFVEYSTNITAGLSKLEDDLKKCIDTTKTGIPVNQIAEIILCVNFNLKTSEIHTLRSLLSSTRITLTVYTLDALAIELHLHHRDLTHQYLGLPLDTGQIVSIEKFIEEYNRASKGISTPLDNTFLHREEELNELKETISQNDFIILTGAPGVGKTKLALEGIKTFLSENLSFEAYCVSYKNHTLLDDLYQYFDSKKDYILFVDDANRIDAFSQITGFYKATRKGKLKILITVRDYAFQDIAILCQEFSPKRIDLKKFTDEQIIDIIKAEPFGILNSDYHKEIVRIADGNPRLAIMTALLAKAKQNIYALADVSDLFENYFSTFIKDKGEFSKVLNIKCLGLISFFYTIPYKNKEITTLILDNFNIEYSKFIDVIDKLDKLELVEIQFEHVKVSEQNLSTYFFYKAFVKDNLLSFETLLNKYFDTNSARFRDCVIPANNTFGYKNVMEKLQPYLQCYWRLIKSEEEKAFKFLSTFWYYLQNETLEFVFNIVEFLQNVDVKEYSVTYEANAFAYNKNRIIELLGEFFRVYNNLLKDVIELSFEYVRKTPEHLPELIHKIKEFLTFDKEDENYNFSRQFILYQVLFEGLNKKDSLYVILFYELSKTFLSFKFHHTEGGRNYSIIWYDYPIPNSKSIQDFRIKIWSALDNNFKIFPTESFNLLQNYSNVRPDISKEIMTFDLPYIINIIEKHLTSISFEHCRYVQDQIRWYKKNDISHSAFTSLTDKFTNPTYEIFLKIDWDRLRDKEMYEFDDYREYERLKEAKIRNSFIFKKTDTEDIEEFYNVFVYLKNTAKQESKYCTTLDQIIDENCIKDFKLGCQLLIKIIERDNEVNYIPRVVFKNQLNTEYKANYIWKLLFLQEFRHKELWELSFYYYLEDSLLNKDYVQALIRTVSSMKEPNTIYFDRLQRFLTIEPDLFQILLKTLVEKNEKEGTHLLVWMDSFSTHFDKLGDDIEFIKKAYLQQNKLQSPFDYDDQGFLNILKKDTAFLLEYVNSFYSLEQYRSSLSEIDLSFIWQVENIETVLKDVFNFVTEKEPYIGIGEHFCNVFFRNLQEEVEERAKNFLIKYCEENYTNSNRMNVIVDIVRNSMREFFDEVLLLFLSLSQDRELFSEIWWRGNGGTIFSGDVNFGDLEAADWRNILSIIEGLDLGIKLIPVKKYINEQIESSLRFADLERQRRFLKKY